MLQIEKVIDPAQLEILGSALAEARFVDGKLSAGSAARRVKNNREVDPKTDIAAQAARIIIGNLYNSPVFRSAVLPVRVATPFFAKYDQGMAYGDHIDDPIMGGGEGQRFRCDIACTVFLNDPGAYDGGELVVHTPFGDQKVKLAAGDAVVYPASSLHRVAEVTRGERLVAVTWIQSMVRDPAQRELLHELNQAREKLLQSAPDAAETKQIDHSYVNLVRMWAEV